MVIRVYATAADYEAVAEEPWEGDDPTLLKRLRAASVEVEKLTRRSIYATDDDGFATNADVADAFTEATCAIVEHWADTDDPRGTDAAQGAVKILSVSLGTTSSNNDGRTEHDKLVARIGDRAIDVLTNAGLISSAVAHW